GLAVFTQLLAGRLGIGTTGLGKAFDLGLLGVGEFNVLHQALHWISMMCAVIHVFGVGAVTLATVRSGQTDACETRGSQTARQKCGQDKISVFHGYTLVAG